MKKTRYYQASSSGICWKDTRKITFLEKLPFYPLSPYAVSFLYAFWILKNYRDHLIFMHCNGILFNHESPRRGETFVTRKITLRVK